MTRVAINVAILGHVDSGKTSLARMLSTLLSTASLDKHPQSMERGITLDLGFSAFKLSSDHGKEYLVTLIDCPGHSSLIKTVIGGAHIMDMAILVIDVTKGLQTQTLECILIAEMTTSKLIIVLNKMDLVEKGSSVVEDCRKQITEHLRNTRFDKVNMIEFSTLSNMGGKELMEAIRKVQDLPVRSGDGPLRLSADHCFSIKGKGTIVTGTVLQGTVKVQDEIEFSSLKMIKKVKSIQCFHESVNSAIQGDRIGICVQGFDASQMERGIVGKPASLRSACGIIAQVQRVRAFHLACTMRSKMHITIGHSTVMATVYPFGSVELRSKIKQYRQNENVKTIREDMRALSLGSLRKDRAPLFEFSLDQEFQHQQELATGHQYVFLALDHDVICPERTIIVGSRLDADVTQETSSRIAFYGTVVHVFEGKRQKNGLPIDIDALRVYQDKSRSGKIDVFPNDSTRFRHEYAIVHSLFQKDNSTAAFLGMEVQTNNGDIGTIESNFGHSGKCRIHFKKGTTAKVKDEVALSYSKLIFEKPKRIFQRKRIVPELKIVQINQSISHQGIIEKLKGETTQDDRNPVIIATGLFSNVESIESYLLAQVHTKYGEVGILEKPFGKSGKVRITFASGTVSKIGDPVYIYNNVTS